MSLAHHFSEARFEVISLCRTPQFANVRNAGSVLGQVTIWIVVGPHGTMAVIDVPGTVTQLDLAEVARRDQAQCMLLFPAYRYKVTNCLSYYTMPVEELHYWSAGRRKRTTSSAVNVDTRRAKRLGRSTEAVNGIR